MIRACLLSILGLLLAGIAVSPAQAGVTAGTVGMPLATCVLRDSPGLDADRAIRAAARFDCTTPQPRFGAGDYWLVSQPLDADTMTRRLAVRVVSVWQTRMTLHAFYADGGRAAIVTDAHGATRALRLGAIVQVLLPRRNAALVRLLWHVEGSANLRGIVVAPTLATAPQTVVSDVTMSAVYAAFAGLCLALLLYNVGLARALRHDFLPFYSLMMITMLAYALSASGALALVMPGIDNNARLRINYLTLAATGVAASAFLTQFFEARVVPPWIVRLVRVACVAVALPAIGIGLLAPWHLRLFDLCYILGFVALIAAVIPIMISAWVRKSAYLWLFVVAWGVPIVLAAGRTAYGLGLIGYSFWLDNSTILSLALEALLSSLAIAYRILLITRERDAAREQESAARLLADTDPLTGLLNRRAFLREAIGRAGDQQLLLIDIDNFKRINDTLGHDGGDEVLRVVARVLRGHGTAATLVARIGGEEFAVVAPAAAPADPHAILAAFRAARMPFDLTVTASIGVCAGALLRESDWKALYCSSDAALFAAKAAGRDRVRNAADQPPAAVAA